MSVKYIINHGGFGNWTKYEYKYDNSGITGGNYIVIAVPTEDAYYAKDRYYYNHTDGSKELYDKYYHNKILFF